ncbi:DNA polymerase subunit gamma-2, mitochondrial isoform X3 [Periplaneta americana]|uniref:DNA polymerase subunit gamma-2, mitochondrial isoform X3 n=1 Tax=Periplaneta americana TaxID=6978 RepID=UPI0037E806BA
MKTSFHTILMKLKVEILSKFSAFPGRFSLTDIHNGQDGQLVEIKADFPWGSETVETIQYIGSKPFENIETTEKELFEVRDGRKKVIPHVIESTVTLESTVLTYLCDAYDEPLFLGVPRNVMRFHRKLAPYKASFSASASSASTGEELSQLSLYLTKQLRIAGVSTLLLPDVAKKSLEAQFARNDELGIPYTIVLNDATLKNGIIGLRSRDTTLKEQVHVTDLKSYMEQLLKNY